jgi:hypothetical protein
MQGIGALVRNSLRLAVLIALSASSGGCARTDAPPHVGYSHCPRDSHSEAYPRNPDPKKAYGCKSDQAGYLEGPAQGDDKSN